MSLARWDDEPRRSCGCPADYHLADCPILTDRYDDPPEPPDPDDDDWMGDRWRDEDDDEGGDR